MPDALLLEAARDGDAPVRELAVWTLLKTAPTRDALVELSGVFERAILPVVQPD